MPPLVRPSADADLPAIAAIYAHAVRHGTASFELEPPDAAEMARRRAAILEGGFPYLVAEVDGTVAAYAYAGPYRPRPAYRYTVEDSIYVAPDRQGAGVGRALLGALVEACTGLGFQQMVAVIGDSASLGSIRLHASLGFRHAGTLESIGWKHGRWLDGVLMQRALGDGAGRPPTERDGPAPMSPDLVPDAELGYERSRTAFRSGAGLALDEVYRLAHLPLVAPDHPDAIASLPGRDYASGRHGTVHSLVLPVDADALEAAAPYRALEAELRASRLAAKLDWSLPPRRRARLHATVCGSLSRGAPPVLDGAQRRALAEMGPFAVELRGLFSGNLNVGRLYLRAYPERRAGGNVVHAIQRALGRPATDLYLVGLHNLVDHLDPDEAADLAALVARWWDRPILRFTADRLWLLASRDDLVLDAEVIETIALG